MSSNKKDFKKSPQKGSDSVDLLLDGLIEVIENISTAFFTLIWKFSKEKFLAWREGRGDSDFSQETLDSEAVFENWEYPIYSHTLKRECNFDTVNFNTNTIACGTTGQGKNVLLDNIMHVRLTQNLPVIFIAPKGDAKDIHQFVLLNKFHNREVVVFSDLYPDSDGFNPIRDGSASAITDRIHTLFDWGNEYYKNVAYDALFKAISFCKGLDPKGSPFVLPKDELKSLFKAAGIEEGEIPFERTEQESLNCFRKCPEEVTFERIENYLLLLFPTEADQKDIKGLFNKITRINNSPFGNLMNNDNAWTFGKVRSERKSLIISISNLTYPTLAKVLSKMFVLDLQHHAGEVFAQNTNGECLAEPTSVIIDEIGTVATPVFINLFNQLRGANLSMCVGFQCLADLKDVDETFHDKLISNSNNFFIGNMKNPNEAEFLGKMIGTEQTQKMTKRVADEEETEDGSIRDADKFLIHPNMMKKINRGQFIVKTFIGEFEISDIITVKHWLTIENLKEMIKASCVQKDDHTRIAPKLRAAHVLTESESPAYIANHQRVRRRGVLKHAKGEKHGAF